MGVVDCHTASLTVLAVFVLALSGSLVPVLYASPSSHVIALRLGNAFAAGFLVAAALVHILPPAIISLSENVATRYPLGGFLALLAICVVFMLDLFARHMQTVQTTLPFHSHRPPSSAHSPAVAIVLAVSLSFHSFLEGVSLGVSRSDSSSFTALSVAILVHKLFAALALGSALTISADGRPELQKRSVYMCLFFAAVTPLGALSGIALLHVLPDHATVVLVPVFNLLSAGVFLYVGMVELLADEFRSASKPGYTDLNPHHSLCSLAVFVLAAAAMSLLALWT
ncbi:unnamed protein product [Agarophyton chilense]